jgi:hypothetical protein
MHRSRAESTDVEIAELPRQVETGRSRIDNGHEVRPALDLQSLLNLHTERLQLLRAIEQCRLLGQPIADLQARLAMNRRAARALLYGATPG